MYDVYNFEDLWIGTFEFEWQAEQFAYDHDGYYVFREE